MSYAADNLAEKLQTLSPEQLAGVDAFVSSLLEAQDEHLVRSAAILSQPSLARIWDNPEDDAYNDL